MSIEKRYRAIGAASSERDSKIGAATLSPACASCPWLDLPLEAWTAERNISAVERLPWGQEVVLEPVDYSSLGEELCECVLSGDEPGPGGGAPAPAAFVSANGTQLKQGRQAFFYVGANVQQALAWAASGNATLLGDLKALLRGAGGSLGLRVARVWAAAAAGDARPPSNRAFDEAPFLVLQPQAGQLNETALRALDAVVALAGSVGLRLILTLADYHAQWGTGLNGIEPYLHLANRVNSLTGVKYRCPGCPGGAAAVTAWADQASEFARCVAPRQLITELLAANPGTWAVCEGVGFEELAGLPFVDFASAHMCCASLRRELRSCAHRTRGTGRPFLLEEFGVPFNEQKRDQMFSLVQNAFEGARAGQSSGGAPSAFAGAMFWGATWGQHYDWDGWGVYLDGSQPLPPPRDLAARLAQEAPAAERKWLADVKAMQAQFRRSTEAAACYESVSELFPAVVGGAYQAFNSNSTLAIVREMVTDAGSADMAAATGAGTQRSRAGGSGPAPAG
eukprot:scaffold2.g7112.t1